MARSKTPLATDAPALEIIAELRQPLAASSNYVAAARLILRNSPSPESRRAIDYLEKADGQILRAGEIMGRLRSKLAGRDSAGPDPL